MRACGEAILLFAVAQGAALLAQETERLPNDVQLERDIPYAEPKNQRQMLDIYTPATGRTCLLWFGFMAAGVVPAKTYGAEATDHVRLDRDLGLPGDAATTELFAFVEAALRK